MSINRYDKRKKRFKNIKYPNLIPKKNQWDKFSIILTTSIGIILISFYMSLFGIIPISKLFSNENDSYFKRTSAIVYSIESKEMYQQTKYGNINTTVGYNIKYRYKINGINYENEEQMSSTANPYYRLYIVQHLNKEAFTVSYEKTNPKNCSLVKEIK